MVAHIPYGGLCLIAGDSGATSSKADVDDASSLTSAPGTGAAVDNPVTTDQPKLEEEESDLQLSWEVLELARLICQRLVGNEVRGMHICASCNTPRCLS